MNNKPKNQLSAKANISLGIAGKFAEGIGLSLVFFLIQHQQVLSYKLGLAIEIFFLGAWLEKKFR